nr:hypothetical protein [Siccirubricoccus soli]
MLHESGSIFVQIGDENVHCVQAVMDEAFGEDNFCSFIAFQKTTGSTTETIPATHDCILFFQRQYTSN